MKSYTSLLLLAAFLGMTLITPAKATEDLPTIYVSIVSHNEEPNGSTHPDFTSDYDTYESFRDAAVAFSEMLHSEGVKYDFQSDWNFLLAEQEHWDEFDNTNGKNLLRWLVEDMGFAVDPHAHESTYSIADVAYLMEQLDITPSNIVGGFISSPSSESRVEDFQVPIEGWKYNTSWEADALWGAATGLHTDDEGQWTSGIWRAQDNENFFIDDPDSKPVIGTYTSTWDGLDDLLEKRENGELESGKMYTATIMTNQEDAQDQDFIDEFQSEIEARQSYTNSGAIEWVTLTEALNIWEDEYNSTPVTYNYEQGDITDSTASTTSTGSEPFTDVDSSDDYYDAITYVYEEGIVEGYSDSTYRSTNSINRAEFTKILIESANPGEAQRSESCFSDVDGAEWYAKYICFAKVYNIVGGYSDGSFKPDQSINIAEALKITLETYFDSIPSASGEWYQKYWDYAGNEDLLLAEWQNADELLNRGAMAELIYRIQTGEQSSVQGAQKALSTRNILFTLNTQEFIFAEESIETLNRVIDIHEEYNVPVDIYLDDTILQTYLDEAPELIERLKSSSVVSVSYHARPPVPYYNDYEWMDFDSMSDAEIEAVIEDYGTHAIDPETGETTDQPGGFTYFQEVFGYAPPAAATPTSGTTGPLVKSYFAENGASFLVENDRDYNWGETRDGIPVRPEDVEIKLFERTDESAEDIFGELDALSGEGPYFMNIKVHDNDFITDESAWVATYVANKKQNGGTLTPPFDLSDAEDRELLSVEEAEQLWEAYENCVAYASENTSSYTLWNMLELVGQL